MNPREKHEGFPGQRLVVVPRPMVAVAIALASTLSPMYIAEIAPARIRGQPVALHQLTIVIGILLAQEGKAFPGAARMRDGVKPSCSNALEASVIELGLDQQ